MATCRAIADAGARLACYDRAAGRPAPSVENARERFGLPARDDALTRPPRAPEPPRVETLDSTVRSVAASGREFALVTLADGSVWRTTERARLPPARGNTVRIRRGALGSYLASFNGARSVRVVRVR